MQSILLQDIPEVIETDRLLIRCPQPGDGPTVYASIVASLGALREFPASLPWAREEPSLEISEQFCREGKARYALRESLPLLIFLKSDNAHVGCSGLHTFDWSVPRCEIGYWGHSGYARRGFMTEAVKAITEFGFTHLAMRRIEARPDEGNGPSCKICERAGYKLEGTIRHDRIAPNGIMRNTRLYSAIR